jgi:hypothetical protein
VIYLNFLKVHREHVWLVLAKLQKAGLYLKLSKCNLEVQRISSVRYIVMPEGIEMEPDQVRTIAEWLEPASHCNIPVFIDFANFYRQFISSFTCLAIPMTKMQKGGKNARFLGPFIPTSAIRLFFTHLRVALTIMPTVVLFDPARPICLKTDASGFAIAGIISQQQDEAHGSAEGAASGVESKKPSIEGQWHLVTFWSRSLSPVERNYAVGNQKILATIIFCRHWRHYLDGAWDLVEVLTYHHNLQRYMTTKLLTCQQARW